MIRTVWVDDWQLQCCGDDFAVGDRVDWTVVDPDPDRLAVPFGDRAPVLTDAEEHHTVDPATSRRLTGVVRAVHATTWRHASAPDGPPNRLHPVPGSGRLEPLQRATGWEKLRSGRLTGYVVRVEVTAAG